MVLCTNKQCHELTGKVSKTCGVAAVELLQFTVAITTVRTADSQQKDSRQSKHGDVLCWN